MRYVSKKFLSDSPDEFGSIACTVSTMQVKDMNEYNVKHPSISGTVRIADCSNDVQLDFYAQSPKAFIKRLEKLDTMIGELTKMRKQYVEMWESYQRDIAHFKQREGIVDEPA